MRLVIAPCGIRHDGNSTGIYWQVEAGDTAIQVEHSVQDTWAHFLPDPDNGDHILLATLLYAMAKGSSLEIRGSLSSKLLDGVEHLQENFMPLQLGERSIMFCFVISIDSSSTLPARSPQCSSVKSSDS